MKTVQAIYPDLAGKVAVVTGSSRGVGAATCHALAANGVKVAINGRDQAAIDETVNSIRANGGIAIGARADCTNYAEIEHMRQQVEAELGPVDILGAFAASGIARPGPAEKITEEEWRSGVDGSLTSTFFTFKSFLPSMIERKRGSIITMSSTAGRHPSQAPLPYAAAKAGVVMLTMHVANEVGKYGIRVNCIAPSAIGSDRVKRMTTPEQLQQLIASFPLGRIGEPEDVANAALFLASDASSWITGVTLDITGGRVMG